VDQKAMPEMPAFAAMQLKSHPFLPEITVNGQQVRFDYLRGPLSPRQDGMPTNFYFDFYDWRDEDQVGKIGQNGRIKQFPDRLYESGMIIIISGASQTGRSSLENLLLFEVENRVSKPISIALKVDIGVGTVQMAQNFASRFTTKVGNYLADQGRAQEGEAVVRKMRDTIASWRESLVPGETNTQFLFEELADHVRRLLPDTPIVFSLNATSHINTPDAWSPLCFMLRDLANFLIISLSTSDHARFLRTVMRDNQVRVAWIDAPRVGANQMTRFLAERLAAERIAPGPQELFPFTEAAIKALFASSQPQGGDIALSIGVAIQKLKGAFDRKCADLQATLGAAPAAPVPPERLEITDADMKQYFAG
jgi:hypothetical protein